MDKFVQKKKLVNNNMFVWQKYCIIDLLKLHCVTIGLHVHNFFFAVQVHSSDNNL